MKRIFAIFLILCLSLPLLLPLGVSATQADEAPPAVYTMTQVATDASIRLENGECIVTISTAEELLAFAAYVSSGKPTAGIYFRQEATITLNKGHFNVDGRWFELDGTTQKTGDPVAFTPIGHREGDPVAFLGTLDGNGYHINGLYINMKAQALGFFALLGPGATVKNLSFRHSFVGGTGTVVGTVAARAEGTAASPVLIDYCTNKGNLSMKLGAVGGIVGSATYTTVANCTNEGWVTGGTHAAGIVAKADAGTEILTCLNLQVARCTGITGGIAAAVSPQTVVKNCLNTAHLAGNEQYGAIVGRKDAAATVGGCYYKIDTASPGIGGTAADDLTQTAAISADKLKSTSFITELNAFHLTDPRIRDLCHPWKRDTDHPLIGETATAVAVSDGTTTFGAGSLSEAARLCGADATLQLFRHTVDPGGDASGTYTLDLNGFTVTLQAPLELKGGTVTVTDTAKTDSPAGKLLSGSTAEAVRLTGGSLVLVAGNIVSTASFAIRCEGIGTLRLPTRPQVMGAEGRDIYLRFANSLYGNGPQPASDTVIVDAMPVGVVCGWGLSPGDTIAKNATLQEYELIDLPRGITAEEQDGAIVAVKAPATTTTARIIALCVAVAFAVMITAYVLSKKLRKPAKK